jgi:hypothetical protein
LSKKATTVQERADLYKTKTAKEIYDVLLKKTDEG